MGELTWLLCTAFSLFLQRSTTSLPRRYLPTFYLLYFSFPCIKTSNSNKKHALANFCKKLFFSVQRFSPFFFFCNTEAANAEVVLQEMFLWILTSLLGCFLLETTLSLWKTLSLCNSFWLAMRPHSKAFFDMRLGLSIIVILAC